MQLKKILATVAATALAVSAMATSAFAAATSTIVDTNYDTANNVWLIYAAADEVKGTEEIKVVDPTTVYGVTFNVTADATQFADAEFWIGGGMGFNSESTGWASTEWGVASGEKPIVFDAETSNLTIQKDVPVFAATDTYAQIWLQAWGGDVVVNAVTLLDKDGAAIKTIGTPVGAEVAEETTAAAEEGDTDTATEDKGNADTGVEGVAAVAGLAIVAAGAVVVAKKRK